MGSKAIGKFDAIVRLDALNEVREGFYKVIHKEGGRVGAVFLKNLNKTSSEILINRCIPEEMFPTHLAVDKAGRGDEK